MAGEIVKRVGKRAYRYAIERTADPETGKTKRVWRYLGPARETEVSGSVTRTTRDRLLDALETLLADRDFEAVTISAVGQTAGLAHGTFYRHFADKDALFEAAVDRIKRALAEAEPHLGLEVGPSGDERERILRWLDALTGIPVGHLALIRAWYSYRTAKGTLAAERRERRANQIAKLAAYLRALDRAGGARIPDARELAAGVYAAIDGVMRRALVEDEPLDAETRGALRTIVLRAIFGDAPT